jgi:hypothetical protein
MRKKARIILISAWRGYDNPCLIDDFLFAQPCARRGIIKKRQLNRASAFCFGAIYPNI